MSSQAVSEVAAPQDRVMRPLFVFSVVRSGSSLLYSLLNQNSQIALLYEAELPMLNLFLRGTFRSGEWMERWEFWNQGPSRNGLDLSSIPRDVANVWEATRAAYQSVATRKGAAIWGEKTPHSCRFASRIAKNFPDARLIFLWRDLNGVMGSITRAGVTSRSFRKSGLFREVVFGTEQLRQTCDRLKARGRCVYEIDYEELTSNPAECMRQICRFLDVPYEEKMASLEGADRSAIFSAEHHTLVRGNRIVNNSKQREKLPAALQTKAERYICRWRCRYAERWPKYPLQLPEGTRPPGLLEFWRDWAAYRLRIFREQVMVVLLHQVRPLFVTKKYVRRSEVVS